MARGRSARNAKHTCGVSSGRIVEGAAAAVSIAAQRGEATASARRRRLPPDRWLPPTPTMRPARAVAARDDFSHLQQRCFDAAQEREAVLCALPPVAANARAGRGAPTTNRQPPARTGHERANAQCSPTLLVGATCYNDALQSPAVDSFCVGGGAQNKSAPPISQFLRPSWLTGARGRLVFTTTFGGLCARRLSELHY